MLVIIRDSLVHRKILPPPSSPLPLAPLTPLTPPASLPPVLSPVSSISFSSPFPIFIAAIAAIASLSQLTHKLWPAEGAQVYNTVSHCLLIQNNGIPPTLSRILLQPFLASFPLLRRGRDLLGLLGVRYRLSFFSLLGRNVVLSLS